MPKKIRIGTLEYLKRKTVELSVADNWEDAKYEWELYGEYRYKQNDGHCICGKKLKYGYWLKNTKNGKFLEVGSADYTGHQKHFPKVQDTIKILKKGKGLMKLWRKYQHHEHESEKICNPYEYSKECFGRFCDKHFNNIKNMSIKECNSSINELKQIKKCYVEFNILDELISKLKKQIFKIEEQQNKAKAEEQKRIMEAKKRAEEEKKERERQAEERKRAIIEEKKEKERQAKIYESAVLYGIFTDSKGDEHVVEFKKSDIIPSWIKLIPEAEVPISESSSLVSESVSK